jgi:hypothetical protein
MIVIFLLKSKPLDKANTLISIFPFNCLAMFVKHMREKQEEIDSLSVTSIPLIIEDIYNIYTVTKTLMFIYYLQPNITYIIKLVLLLAVTSLIPTPLQANNPVFYISIVCVMTTPLGS